LAPEEGFERAISVAPSREGDAAPTTKQFGAQAHAGARDHGLSPGLVTLAPSDEDLSRELAEAVLAGDHARAEAIARSMRGEPEKPAAAAADPARKLRLVK
jgi:hypothetical protein